MTRIATLVALVAVLGGVVTGDTSPGASVADRVQRLSQKVERAESVRAVKRLQETYAQYSQFGLWNEMAALFSDNAQLSRGKDEVRGRQAIQEYFLTTFGEGTNGLKPGGLHTQIVLRPLVNVSADGQTAKCRWWEFSMTGRLGVKAEWAAGIFENEYVRERGAWKISRLRYNPMFAGPYATGWRNIDADQKIVPYHFTPDQTGIPVPDLPAPAVAPADSTLNPSSALAALEQRIAAMNDEDLVRNLQNAYGYYMDRKMWDDVTDLFAADGVLSIAGDGVFKSPAGIRRALERSGPAGVKHGELNELMQLDMSVAVENGGTEARGRGLEFGMLGDADRGTAFYTLAIFENRYAKQDGIWRIREMQIFPLLKTEYAQGWAKSNLVKADGLVPVFFAPNPATGKSVLLPAGVKTLGGERLLPPPAAPVRVAAKGDLNARITEAERRLAVSKAWDGAENMSSAYGDYLDDLDFARLAKLFARDGSKEIPFSGVYVGRESIAKRDATSPPPGSRPRVMLPLHWRTQPVILVASDGRSASVRSRLFQPASASNRAMGFGGGMYHDQVVLEDGVWKLWSVTIDEHYFSSPTYEGGWSSAKDPAPSARRPVAQANDYPPDIPLTALGERERGFRGGTGDMLVWPQILPMWFHYKNPVSGRVPEFYWPDCITCLQYPETSMKNHGYLLPPDGAPVMAAQAPSAQAAPSPKAHWEPYKLQRPRPSVDQHLTDPALAGAIDLHAHYGPDSYDRQWDAFEVVKLAKERGMRGVVLKNHWSESAGLVQLIRKYGTQGIDVFGSVTLDTPTGGVNPMAVRYMADVEGNWGRIVWMPTHDSEHEVTYNKETRAKAIVSRNGKLIPEVFEVLDLIKERNLTLATGHVEPWEALAIMAEAKTLGITRIIVTHPLLGPQFTNMSLEQMQESVKLGGAIEITANTLFRDGAGKTRAIEVIKALGTQNVFVGSDSGLVGTPNHPDALAMAAKSLRAAGFTEQDLNRMFKDTPARLVGLPVLPATAQIPVRDASEPMVIQKQGSFAAGGTILGDAKTRSLSCDHGYVDYQIPVNPRRTNLVMWHSAAAHAFLNRWDGGEGYRNIFLRRGYPVYIWDGPQVGRANWGCTESTYKPGIGRDQGNFTAWRFGVQYPNWFDGVQFPKDNAEAWNQASRARYLEFDTIENAQMQSDAAAKLLDRIGPSVAITNSAGGMRAILTALKTNNMAAIVMYENVGYVYPAGEGPGTPQTGFGPIEVPLEEFKKLAKVPMQMVWGDNVDKSASYSNSYKLSLLFAEKVNKYGGKAQVLRLPDAGLHGNTHLPFADMNNVAVADLLSKYLAENGLDKR